MRGGDSIWEDVAIVAERRRRVGGPRQKGALRAVER